MIYKKIYKFRNIFAFLIVIVLLGSMFLSATPAVAEELSAEEMQPINETGNEQVMPLAMEFNPTWFATTAATTLMYAPYPNISAATSYTIPAGQGVWLIGRTYDCYYVHYDVPGGKVMRGYIPVSALNPTSYIWIDYDVFLPATCTATTPVLSGPGTTNTYYATGEIYAGEDPLMVLGTEVNTYNNVAYYYIQYQTSSGLVKRGWIDPRGGTVTINNLSWSNLSTANEYIIMNVATGKVLHWNTDNTVVQKTLSDRDRQLFKIEQSTVTGYYRILPARDTSLALSINTNSYHEGLSVIVETKAPVRKGQEFYIEADSYDPATYRAKYGIRTRVTGNFRGMEVYGSSAAEGAGIIQSLYYGNANQQWIFLPYIEKQARILYDSSNTYSVAGLKELYMEATDYLFEEFDVDFSIQSVQLASNLNGSSCLNTTLHVSCSTSCGAYETCSTAHHKSSSRLLGLNQSTAYHTATLVGHALCNYSGGAHKAVFGTGYVGAPGFIGTTDTSVSDRAETIDTILHELTHNLNATHDACTEGENCILKGDAMGQWCSTCYDRIYIYLYGE